MVSSKAILIDLDDTLYEERRYVESGFEAVAAFLEKERDLPADYSYPSMLAFLELEGRGKVFDRIIERFEVRQADGLVETCVEVYRNHTPKISAYPDVEQTLQRLSGEYGLALVTNGLPLMQQHKVDALGLAGYFRSMVFCDAFNAPKPATAGLEKALADLGVPASEAIFVGDNPETDGAAAAALGIPFIRVKTARFQNVATSAPEIQQFHELPAFLSQRSGNLNL